ncbi:DUF2867 domain-containing protein [Nocardia sp. NPDC052112]|uniref:DUF2867 domain-containing protein n=1 Tax=Nocardia sp. NPDC052112 TaxID=3155646 RepID=UPI0034270D17
MPIYGRVEIPERAALARSSGANWDYIDSYEVVLPPGAPTDPREWTRKIFFGKPFLDRESDEREHLTADMMAVLDFVVSVLVHDDTVTITSLVEYRNRWGRMYFAVIRPFHRRLTPWMLARAARGFAAAR